MQIPNAFALLDFTLDLELGYAKNWIMDMTGSENVKRLKTIIARGRADPSRAPLLWAGAGLSIPSGYPSLGRLAEMLRNASPAALPTGLSPMEAIDAFVKENGQGDLSEALADIFDRKKPLQFHKDLMKLPWKAVITTNYDELLEDALKEADKPFLKVTPGQNLDLTARPDLPLFKIHGDITDFKSMVLSGESYATYGRRYALLKRDLESLLRKHHVVYFGCSMTDPRLMEWLRSLGKGNRAMLMSSCAVITKNSWKRIPQDTRALLDEAYIKPVFVKDHSKIPELINYLLTEIMPGPGQGEFRLAIGPAPGSDTQWRVVDFNGNERLVDLPWKNNYRFMDSLNEFSKMAHKRASTPKDRQTLHTHAFRLGQTLAQTVFTDADRRAIISAGNPDGPPPLVTIESRDDMVLSLPWELLCLDGQFPIREGRMDLVRATPSLSANPPCLELPDRYMSLVVNVSAPRGRQIGHLDYEAESYRITLALHEHIPVHFTELGTMTDLVQEVAAHEPLGIHFSGHGAPGRLLFEDDEGMENLVDIHELVNRIKTEEPGKFPRFAYLACCHGNTPAKPDEQKAGSTIAAAQLNREGVVQVIGYFGPIVDELSTLAEVEIYRAIARGKTTLYAVRKARAALASGAVELCKGVHRGKAEKDMGRVFPFAWAQLVLYHRGPNHPLSMKLPHGYIQRQEAGLKRTFSKDIGQRRELTTGFVGRRKELHKFRQQLRNGRSVFVFQGLGGLGKSTLAFKVLPMLAQKAPVLTIWCQEIDKEEDQASALCARLSEFAQGLFGDPWINVVQAVDRMPGATRAQRFGLFLDILLKNVNHFTLHFENMESLLDGPESQDPKAFGKWRSPEVETIWAHVKQMAGGKLKVLASCRYVNKAFENQVVHVPEMGSNAIFRLMGWFDGLRRLSLQNRAGLVNLVHGHPRAVEYLDDLVQDSLRQWESRYGQWSRTEDEAANEWRDIIQPALPRVEKRLIENLLLDKIWEKVLDTPCRNMLFRMTVLRRPWDWDLMMELGEPGQLKAEAEKTAARLRQTSLLGELDEKTNNTWLRLFHIHPSTKSYIRKKFDNTQAEALRLAACLRVGTYLENKAKTSQDLWDDLDGGHYLFECHEFDRACEILVSASDVLRQWGQAREAIAVLAPFQKKKVLDRMNPQLTGNLLGTLGLAHWELADVQQAIKYYEQALVIHREINDRRGEGSELGNLGIAYSDLGQVEKAIEYHEQALVIAREINDRRGEGADLGSLGNAYSDLGRVEKAIEYYEQALVIAREINDRRGEGNYLGNLGNAYMVLGQVEKAIEYYEQALVIFREINDRRGEGSVLGNLGNAYRALGQVEKAIEYYEQALVIAREINDRRGEGNHLGNLGIAYRDLGQVEKAIEYHEQALVIAREINDRRGEGNRLGNLGIAYRDLGRMEKAKKYLTKALSIGKEIKDPNIIKIASNALKKIDK